MLCISYDVKPSNEAGVRGGSGGAVGEWALVEVFFEIRDLISYVGNGLYYGV